MPVSIVESTSTVGEGVRSADALLVVLDEDDSSAAL